MIDLLAGFFPSNNAEFTNILKEAFPGNVSNDCAKVARIVPSSSLQRIQFIRKPIYLQDEKIYIPYRIYSPQPKQELISTLTPIQFSIFCCFYTRHHNGYFRQKYAEMLLSRNDPWIPPYVLLLIGEYVVEINIMLQENIKKLPILLYIRFCQNNPEFVQLISKRIISYWDCYYRSLYPNIEDYPAYIVANQLGIQMKQF